MNNINYDKFDESPFRHLHLKRLVFIALLLLAVFFTVRALLLPKTFFQTGHYRGDNVKEWRAYQGKHAGAATCALCHENQHGEWQKASHQTVNCEVCHSPAQAHSEDPSTIKPKKPHGRNFCALCHGQNISRPKKFPQIDLKTHNAGLECLTCHNPHQPKL